MYQGWAEPGIPPANLVKYFDEIQQKTSGAKDSVRVFMVPGMGHCGGGNGTSTFNRSRRSMAGGTVDRRSTPGL